jgi:hypothetical protein
MNRRSKLLLRKGRLEVSHGGHLRVASLGAPKEATLSKEATEESHMVIFDKSLGLRGVLTEGSHISGGRRQLPLFATGTTSFNGLASFLCDHQLPPTNCVCRPSVQVAIGNPKSMVGPSLGHPVAFGS